MDDGNMATAKPSENASISFDWTIEMTASGDEAEASISKGTMNAPKTLVAKHQNMPLISPDDGSMAWDEVSVSSIASKSILGGPRVRFQGVTAFHPAAQITEDEEKSMIDKLQHNISRQRSLRKRKEKALIKLARELTKRTDEVQQRDVTIAEQTKTIHQLQVQNAASSSSEQEITHLRKELLRLQLSNDRLQTRGMISLPGWSLIAAVISIILACWMVHLLRMLL